jgi:toxin ParE1/3/4
MRRLVYLSSAESNLRSTQKYLIRQSRSVAVGRAFVAVLRGQCARLASLPGTLGRPRPELHPGLRSFPFRGYVIFFRYNGEDLEVVAVLKGHRDMVEYFQEGEGSALDPLGPTAPDPSS